MPSRTRRQAQQKKTGETDSSSDLHEGSSSMHNRPPASPLQSSEVTSRQGASATGGRREFQPPPSHVHLSLAKPVVTRTASRPNERASDSQGDRGSVRWSTDGGKAQPGSFVFSPTRPHQPRSRHNRQGMMDRNDMDGMNVLQAPLGSFDSPTRGNSSDDEKRRPSPPRTSPPPPPPPGYGYTGYYGNPPPPHHHQQQYGYQPPSSYRSYYPPPPPGYYAEAPPWASPPPPEESYAPPARESPPRSAAATPEKKIFRSPPASSKQRSPFHQSPTIGAFGSFGMMDTPGGTLAADFSPMGVSFTAFEDPGGEPFPTKLQLSRTDSGEFDGTPFKDRPSRLPMEQSPFSGFISEFSPLGDRLGGGLAGVSRSPVRSGADRRGVVPPQVTQSKKEENVKPVHRTLRPSPLQTLTEVKPRVLWQPEGASDRHERKRSAMRLELGQSGASMSHRFERFNNMMRAQSSGGPSRTTPGQTQPPYGHPSHPMSHSQPPYPPPPPPPPPPPAQYKPPMQTPTASSSAPPRGASSASSSRGYGPPPPSSSAKAPPAFPSSKAAETTKPTPVSAKENSRASTPSKRTPCNCKKSKCLKLYCECFSSMQYCDGCNCIDCNNTSAHQAVREKAITDTRSKNSKAFEPRISTGHNMGCRCKRSECLKKYCECFQAGVLCSPKCKCSSCMNRAGSQKLIDKRRKMKDTVGAEFAMRVSQETWKGQGQSGRKPSRGQSNPPPPPPGAPPPGHAPPPGPYTHHYLHHPSYMNHHIRPPVGYHPMGAPNVTPGYGDPRGPPFPPPPRPFSTKEPPKEAATESRKRPPPDVTPSAPRTPATRLAFDIASSRKKRKLDNGDEDTYAYFGLALPAQPKTTALAIFSYLSHDSAYKAAMVCKTWKQLATDEELWQFNESSQS